MKHLLARLGWHWATSNGVVRRYTGRNLYERFKA